MSPSFHAAPLRWDARGYFTPPVPDDNIRLLKDPDARAWLQTQDHLQHLKSGSFDRIDDLMTLYNSSRTEMLRWVCAQILGDAGTRRFFARLAQDLDETLDPDKALRFCNALEAWGSLSAVPVIIQSYDRYFGWQDAESLPLMLSTILEPEWGPLTERPSESDFLAYEDRVMERYGELKDKYGTDQILLLHGELFGVRPLARRMLRNLGSSHFEKAMQPFYRRRFEASTGIDCSCFYQGREFQPLTAAALLEEFLESPEAARYEDGVRYFFGHRIPE
jgi:hypothetical protein